MVTTNEDLIRRFSNVDRDGGSGRDLIYERLLIAWWRSSDYFQFIFGYGFAGTVRFVYTFSHNDLLEIAVNYGMIGLLIYILLWFKLYKIIKTPELPPLYRFALTAVLIMWIVDSMYHRFFSGLYSAPTVMVIGYIIGKYELVKSASVNAKKES